MLKLQKKKASVTELTTKRFKMRFGEKRCYSCSHCDCRCRRDEPNGERWYTCVKFGKMVEEDQLCTDYEKHPLRS